MCKASFFIIVSSCFEEQIDRFFTLDSKWWDEHRPRQKAELNAYYSWPNDDPIDIFSLIFFSDSMTPPVYNRLGSRAGAFNRAYSSYQRNSTPGPV